MDNELKKKLDAYIGNALVDTVSFFSKKSKQEPIAKNILGNLI